MLSFPAHLLIFNDLTAISTSSDVNGFVIAFRGVWGETFDAAGNDEQSLTSLSQTNFRKEVARCEADSEDGKQDAALRDKWESSTGHSFLGPDSKTRN